MSAKEVSAHVEKRASADLSEWNEDLATQGAQIEEEERQLGVWQVIKLHKTACLVCAVAFSAPLTVAYDNIANGATLAMPSFFLYYGDMTSHGPVLPSTWVSLWGAMTSLAQAFGASSVGFVSDRYGRKWPAVGSGIITLIGTAVQFWAMSRGMLLAGKMINGFALGSLLSVATTYASEIAPLRIKGLIQSALVLFTVISFAIALGIVRAFVPDIRPSAFKTVFAIQWAVGGIASIVFFLAPESPAFLVANKKLDAAQKVIARIYKTHAEARTAYLIKTIREEQKSNELRRGGYIECFQGKNLKRTLTACTIFSAHNIAGAPLLGQNILILIIAGLNPINAFDIGIGGFGLAILIILATWAFTNQISRRTVYMSGNYINCVGMIIIGAMYYVTGTAGLWVAAVVMNLLITFQTALIQGSGFPIAVDVSSFRLRQKTLSIALTCQTIIGWLLSFIVPYIYNVDAGNLGLRSAFVFFATSVILTAVSFFLIPDTTNLTAVEIDNAYETNIAPRQFQQKARLTNPSSSHDV